MELSLSNPIAYGRTAEVYDWKAGLILKLYYDWCPAGWVEYESKVAHAVAAAGIPSPAPGEIIDINGRRGIIYERVTGISMLQDMNRRPWSCIRHARSLAELHVKINQLSVPGLHSFKDGLTKIIRGAPHLSERLRAAVLDLLPDLPDGDKLCHGDFHPGNVMLTGKGVTVIDWMTACIGSPWADFTRTGILLTIGPKSAGKQLNPLIRLLINLIHQTYERRYLELMPDTKDERKRWIPIIAAARLEERIEPEWQALVKLVERGSGPGI